MGFSQVASILFPTDFLGGIIYPFKPGRKRFAVPMAPPGHAIEVGAYYSREEPSTIKTSLINAGSTPIGFMSLPGGENVIFAVHVILFDAALIPSASKGVGHALSGAPKVGEVIEDCGAVLLHHIPADGEIVTLAEINGIAIKRNC